MATNLSLDPRLIELAVKVGGGRTKKTAVTRALEEYVARRKQKRLADLMSKLERDESFDYKFERFPAVTIVSLLECFHVGYRSPVARGRQGAPRNPRGRSRPPRLRRVL
jgi:hypothetical protein